MRERQEREIEARDQAFRSYVKDAAGTGSADELSRLADLHQRGVINDREFERGKEKMREYEQELKNLGVELKDYYIGLIDFPCWMDGREVNLCWKLGEPEVAHWHELDAGYSGRQRLLTGATQT